MVCFHTEKMVFVNSMIRRQQEAELKLLEEETARRLEEAIRKNVDERLNSEEVKLEIERRVEEGQKKLFDDVVAQLQREKEAALAEARRKEVRNLTGASYYHESLFVLFNVTG